MNKATRTKIIHAICEDYEVGFHRNGLAKESEYTCHRVKYVSLDLGYYYRTFIGQHSLPDFHDTPGDRPKRILLLLLFLETYGEDFDKVEE